MAVTASSVEQAMGRQLVIGTQADHRALSGDEKAALLLLALGPDHGKPILEELDEMEVKALSRTMVRLGPVSQEMLDNLFAEFVTSVSANGSVSGNSDTTQRLLLSFLPQDRVDAIMEEIRGPAGRNMWEKLSNVQEDILATYLKNEYPQTIAVVLSKIDTEHASKVLAALPEDLAMDVVKRMLSLDPVQKEILEKIEQTLRTEFMSTLSHSKRRDSHEQMAEIFNSFDRQTEARFITSLEENDREGAERIKSLMFTFEPSRHCSPRSTRRISASPSRGPTTRSRSSSSPTCRRAPASCSRTTWRPWAPCVSRMSTKPRPAWSPPPRIWRRAVRS